MLFLLDNYDSFTYNLVQYLTEMGADIVVRRNDELAVDDVANMHPSAIVLSPGPGRPENSGILNRLVERMAVEVPILGVCLGHQAIAQVYGGTIGYAPTLMHGKTSLVYHDKSEIYRGVESPFEATRYHSLTVAPDSLPEDFSLTAWTSDRVIMGIQHKQLPLYGMQYHPESIMTTQGKQLLKNFLETT